MTSFSRGDIVLVPFPHTESSHDSKKRPALIISTNTYHKACRDVIVAQITSHISAPPRPGDHTIAGWRKAGLLAPSLLRARLATLRQDLLARKLGTLDHRDIRAFDRALSLALGLTGEHPNG